ncbi:unnamed protein product [Soboliphyme baturini]|uniref:Uncharacterized protein n=1 Tax=Soboliphyme baturini TaxID=241478 RepID=A0A183J3J1_9BILA|nr:unnamed protein product [Soboliphyme baturini]
MGINLYVARCGVIPIKSLSSCSSSDGWRSTADAKKETANVCASASTSFFVFVLSCLVIRFSRSFSDVLVIIGNLSVENDLTLAVGTHNSSDDNMSHNGWRRERPTPHFAQQLADVRRQRTLHYSICVFSPKMMDRLDSGVLEPILN